MTLELNTEGIQPNSTCAMLTLARPLLDPSRAWKTPGRDKEYHLANPATVRLSGQFPHATALLRTEHVFQTDNAGEVVVKVNVVVCVGEPQADELQELVVQVHSFSGAGRKMFMHLYIPFFLVMFFKMHGMLTKDLVNKI